MMFGDYYFNPVSFALIVAGLGFMGITVMLYSIFVFWEIKFVSVLFWYGLVGLCSFVIGVVWDLLKMRQLKRRLGCNENNLV